MTGKEKTKEQFTSELAAMRQRVAELEAVETEHKRVEEALRDREERYRYLVEEINDVIYAVDEDGVITYISPVVESLGGYVASEIIGRPLTDFMYSEDVPRAEELLQEIISSRLERTTEYRLLTKSGRIRWIRAYSRPIIKENHVVGLQGVMTDITARKLAEESLLRRNRELALLNRASRRLTSTLDLDQVLIAVLDEVRGLLGVVASSVWLIDPATDELVCRQSTGLQNEIVRGWRLSPGQGLAGWTVRSGENLIVPDTRLDERHFKEVDRRTGLELRSILNVPLRVKDGVIGVLQVMATEVDRFSAADLELLVPLAAPAAIGIDNARLYQETDSLRAFNESIVQSMDEGIFLGDATGHITFVNPKAVELLGHTPEELVGQHWTAIVSPEHVAEVEEKAAKWPQDIASRYETVLVDREGRRVPVVVSARPLFDEIPGQGGERRFAGVLSVFTDITERKQAEAEREYLLAAEREQHLLAETLREVTLTLTSQTSHEAVLDEILRQVKRIVPYRTAHIMLLEDGILHAAWWQGYDTSGSEEFISSLVQRLTDLPLDADIVQSQKPLAIHDVRQEKRWTVADETAWVRSHLSVPICLHNRVLGLLRLDSDTPGEFTTEDARRLQPLANAAAIAIENARLVEGLEAEVTARTAEFVVEQEKSEAILRSVGEAIAMIDFAMRVQYVNEAFTTLTGYTASEARGVHLSAEQAGSDSLIGERLSVSDQQFLAQGKTWQGEVTIRRKDGRTYDAGLTIAPVRDAEGRLVGYVSSHRDISRLKELDRARSRFMTNVSHELRTPVANVKLYVSLLRTGRRPEKTERYLEVLEEQSGRLEELVQDILEMTALDSGRVAIVWKLVSLFTLIGDAVTRYQSQSEASGLTLVAKPVPPDLPAVKGDQVRLAQALGELVENAVTFTPAGGRVTVEAGTVKEGEQSWVTIAVHDTGPGISPEEQERVFDRFYRGSLAESGHIPGTGLGLSIAQEIMQAHGGRVTVESPLTLRQDPWSSGSGTEGSGPALLETGLPGEGAESWASAQGSTFTLWLRPEPLA